MHRGKGTAATVRDEPRKFSLINQRPGGGADVGDAPRGPRASWGTATLPACHSLRMVVPGPVQEQLSQMTQTNLPVLEPKSPCHLLGNKLQGFKDGAEPGCQVGSP